MSVRIVIADDHKIIRQGLKSLLSRVAEMDVIGEAADGREAVKLVKELRPGVVIMDVAMPNLNGIEATRQIADEVVGVKIIALSMHADAQFVSRMLEAGASGYLLKDGAFEELAEAVEAVMRGRRYLSPAVADVMVEDYVQHLPRDGVSSPPELTPREREVLQQIADGKSTRETAGELDVSVKTIETHRHNIMEKLGLHSVAQLTKYAIRRGLTELER